MNRLSPALLALTLSGAGAPAMAATVVTFHAPSHAIAGGLVPVRLEFRETAGGPLPEVISFQLTVSGSPRFGSPRKGRVIGGAGTSAIFARAEDGVFDIDVSTPVAEAIRFVFADSSGEGIAAPTRTIFADGVENGRPRWYGSTLGGPLAGWSPVEAPGESEVPRDGTRAWWSGPWTRSQDSALISAPVSFPVRGVIRLRLVHRYGFEPPECVSADKGHHGARVEAEVEPGRWVSLEPAAGYPAAVESSCAQPLSGQRAFAGSTGGRFREELFDLNSLTGRRARLRLRLATGCEDCGPAEGWFADDFSVIAGELAMKAMAAGEDADRDGLLNEVEIARGSDPEAADTDGDGLPDGAEDSTGIFAGRHAAGTDPLSPDTDGGGVPDGAEALVGNDPNDPRDETERQGFDLDLEAGAERKWKIRGDGTAGPSAADPLQELFSGKGGFRLLMEFLPFLPQSEAYRRGNTYFLGPQQLGPFLVTRTIFASGEEKYLRYLETFENVSAAPQTRKVTVECEFASKEWVEVEDRRGGRDGNGGGTAWSSGDDFVHFNDRDPLDGMPGLLWLYSGPGARIEPQAVELKEGVARAAFQLDLQPGERRSLLHYAVQSTSLEEGRAAARLLGKGGPEAARDLPPGDEEWIVNLALDRDGDGLAGYYEVQHGLDPLDPSDGALDPDGDGLSNLEEFRHGADPRSPDTDGDGLSDGKEAAGLGTDPTRADSDSDGIPDGKDPFPREALLVSFAGDRYAAAGSAAALEARIGANGAPFPSPVKLTLVLEGAPGVFTGPVEGGTALEGIETPSLVVEVERGLLRVRVKAEDAGRRTIRVIDSAGAGLFAPTVFFKDFEAEGGGLEAAGPAGVWKWGEPAGGAPGAFSGKKVWSTGLEGDYPPDAVDTLTTPELFLADAAGAVLEMASFLSIEEGIDEARVQVSSNGGRFADLVPPLRNSPGDYQQLRMPLDGFRGSSVRVRFLFASDGSIEGPGWFIDDLRVSGLRSEGVVDFLDPAGDLDRDGLTNGAELARGTNPAAADTDADDLSDAVETGTGVFAGERDTGTDPRNPDTDGGGESDGPEVKAGRNPLEPFDDQLEPSFLPPDFTVPLRDGGGTVWGATSWGAARIPEEDVLIELNELHVDGDFFFTGEAILTHHQQMLVFRSDPDFFSGPPSARWLFASPEKRFLRWLEVFENPAARETPVAVNLFSICAAFGSPTEVVATSSGDQVVGDEDRSFILKLTRGGEPVFIGHLLWNPGAELRPASTRLQFGALVNVDYSLLIPPRGRVSLLHFVVLAPKQEEVEKLLEELERPDGAALAGLREADLAAVSNFLIDQDRDGLPDTYEKAHGFDPVVPDGELDADGDGLSNLEEYRWETDPRLADTDGDGLSDGDEVGKLHTDPRQRDTDADGIPDGGDTFPLARLVVRERARVFGIAGEVTRLRFRVESAEPATLPALDRIPFTLRFSAPLEVTGVPAGELVGPAGENRFSFRTAGNLLVLEVRAATEGPVTTTVEDSEGVGISGDTPLIQMVSSAADSDGDGLPDGFEAERGIDPLAGDTDGDGLGDRFETGSGMVARAAELGTFPWAADSDGGGSLDRDEIAAGTDPVDGGDDLQPAALPVTLNGAAGKWLALPSWALTGSDAGSNDLDNAGVLFVNGMPPAIGRRAMVAPAGTAVALGPEVAGGLEVSRFIHAHPLQPVLRFTELIRNPLAEPAAVEMEIRFDLSADTSVVIDSTSSGDAILDRRDRWVLTRDQRGAGVARVFFGGESLQEIEIREGDLLRERYLFEVPAGESRALVHYLARGIPRADLRTLAGRLLALAGGALDGLPVETARLAVNLPPVTPIIWDRFPHGQVTAGGRFELAGEFLGRELKVLVGGQPAELVAAFPERLVLLAPAEAGEISLETLDASGRAIFSEMLPVVPAKGHFRRGDLDGDARVDLTDAVLIIGYLVLGGGPPACLDSADADDTGKVDLTDAIFLLQALFEGAGFLPYPGGAAGGPDPTPDGTEC